MHMRIRPATQADAKDLENFLTFVNGDAFGKLAKDYIACAFSGDFKKPRFIIAEIPDTGKLIGAYAYSEEIFTITVYGISWVSIHPEYQNNGYGSQLIQHAIKEIKKETNGPATIILNTYPDKTGLYDRNGFTRGGKDTHGGQFMLYHLQD